MGNAILKDTNSSTLAVTRAHLVSLPQNLNKFPRPTLKQADLSSNILHDFPELYAVAPNLRILRLENNRFTTIPSSLAHLPSLFELNLAYNYITNLPHLTIPYLHSLNLGYNLIVSIPHDIGILFPQIQQLSLRCNRLQNLTADFNPIRSIELHAESSLDTLSIVSLRYTKLKTLSPSFYTKLKNLSQLFLNDCEIDNLADDFFDHLPALTELNLTGNSLQVLPSSITNTKNLEHLKVAKNKLLSCPPLLTTGKGCKIDLSFNFLTRLPAVGENVSSLVVSHNKITQISEELLLATKLTNLNLSFNNLSSLPISLVNLPLVSLHLTGNFISSLPLPFTFPPSLQCLDISFNHLLSFPPGIASLTSLVTLSLSFNRICHVPPWTLLLPKLTTLTLSGNLIEHFPSFRSVSRFVTNCHRFKHIIRKAEKASQLPTPLFSPPLQSLSAVSSYAQTPSFSRRGSPTLSRSSSFASSPAPNPYTSFLLTRHFQDYDAPVRIEYSTFADKAVIISSLKHLFLNSNRLTRFPSIVLHFHELETLFVGHNRINKIPDPLFHLLPRLSRFDISFSRLKELPPHLITSVRLPTPIHTEPSELSTPIVFCDVSHNQITNIPLRILYSRPSFQPHLLSPCLSHQFRSPVSSSRINTCQELTRFTEMMGSGDIISSRVYSSLSSPQPFADVDDDEPSTGCFCFRKKPKPQVDIPVCVIPTVYDEEDSASEDNFETSPKTREKKVKKHYYRVANAVAKSKGALLNTPPSNMPVSLFMQPTDRDVVPLHFFDMSFTNIGKVYFDENMADFVHLAHTHPSLKPLTYDTPGDRPEEPRVVSQDRANEELEEMDSSSTSIGTSLSQFMAPLLSFPQRESPLIGPTQPSHFEYLARTDAYVSSYFLATAHLGDPQTILLRNTSSSISPIGVSPFFSFESSSYFDFEFKRVESILIANTALSTHDLPLQPITTGALSDFHVNEPKCDYPLCSVLNLNCDGVSDDVSSDDHEEIEEEEEEDMSLLDMQTLDRLHADRPIPPKPRLSPEGRRPMEKYSTTLCPDCFNGSTDPIVPEEPSSPQPSENAEDEEGMNFLTPDCSMHEPVKTNYCHVRRKRKHATSRTVKRGDTPSLAIHNVGCAETCGRRQTMEDTVLLFPCGGWDLAALAEDGESGIITRLLSYPQEYRFTTRGVRTMELLEENYWNRRMRRKERKERARLYAKQGLSPEEIDRQEAERENGPCDHFFCPYNHSPIRGCGLFGVIDGHGGSDVAHFISSHFVPTLVAVVSADAPSRRHIARRRAKAAGHMSPPPNTQATSGYFSALLKETALLLNQQLRQTYSSISRTQGACCVIAAVTPSHVYLLNIGDCRAVLVSRFANTNKANADGLNVLDYKFVSQQLSFPGQMTSPDDEPDFSGLPSPVGMGTPAPLPSASDDHNQLTAHSFGPTDALHRHFLHSPEIGSVVVGKDLTVDHKPTFERERDSIYGPTPDGRASGMIGFEDRVNGRLAISRAFGDFDLEPAINPEPDLYSFEIKRWKGICFESSYNDSPTLNMDSENGASPTSFSDHSSPLENAPATVNFELTDINENETHESLPSASTIELKQLLDKHLLPLAPFVSLYHDYNDLHSVFLAANIPPFVLPKQHSTYFPPSKFTPSSLAHGTPVQSTVFRREDICLVLGCDGLFDVLNAEQIAEIACPWMQGGMDWLNDPALDRSDCEETDEDDSEHSSEEDPIFARYFPRTPLAKQRTNDTDSISHGYRYITKGKLATLAACRLRSAAVALDSQDNISVMAIFL
ncbi:putative Protein scribble like protein [Blattamonas nauphoetae]|uniref:PPM-type phosphatase domain-containing protein n=1 Tax=Blattamonas nauphoetae TaxID=2049346 RepID=A0ABQ9XFM0_9EUKA|nr:putative Protein scribble like protein [Blattamonas nauphoetae]